MLSAVGLLYTLNFLDMAFQVLVITDGTVYSWLKTKAVNHLTTDANSSMSQSEFEPTTQSRHQARVNQVTIGSSFAPHRLSQSEAKQNQILKHELLPTRNWKPLYHASVQDNQIVSVTKISCYLFMSLHLATREDCRRNSSYPTKFFLLFCRRCLSYNSPVRGWVRRIFSYEKRSQRCGSQTTGRPLH